MLTDTQKRWAQSPKARRVLTVEIPATDQLQAVYLASEPFTSSGSLDAHFRGLITEEFVLRRAVGGFLLGGGSAETGIGNITVDDSRKEFSDWTTLDWHERLVTIRWGSPEWADIDDHIIVANATVNEVRASGTNKVISLLPQLDFGGVTMPARRYAGSTGGESFGELIQVGFGHIKDAPVQLIDPNTLKYGVQDSDLYKYEDLMGNSTLTVKDNGVELREGTDWTVTTVGTFGPGSFHQIDLDNVVGTVTFDSVDAMLGQTARQVINAIGLATQKLKPWIFLTQTDIELNSIDVGIFVNKPTTVSEMFDQIALSTGSVWFSSETAQSGLPGPVFRQVKVPANPIVTFSEDEITGGVSSQIASRPIDSITIGVRNSWATSGDDAIDPALAPKIKRDLQKTHRFQVASIDPEKVQAQEPPLDVEPIETLLTNPTEAFEEGVRWQKLLSVERRLHTFSAITGAGRVEPADTIRLQHSDLADYSPLVDHNGEAITGPDFQPIHEGFDLLVKTLEESFPSGAVQIEGWG